MNKSTSLYLDLIRALAAMAVFLYHAGMPFFSTGQSWAPHFGHEMVVVFFVLSGFVIAFAGDKSSQGWRPFAADRLSRLMSVAIPALVLTVVLDQIGRRISPDLYRVEVRSDNYGVRIGLASVFMNQSWNLSSRPGSNGPFWSLAYEFWYYALFCGLFFARTWVWKIAAIFGFVLMTGYKIALLLPVWLLGVASYHVCRRRLVTPRAGMVLAAVSSAVIAAILADWIVLPGHHPGWIPQSPLFFSGHFVPDNLLGLFVAIHFVGMDAMLRGHTPNPEDAKSRLIRFTSARSFSLYVFHMPLMVFFKALIPFNGADPLHVVGVLILCLAVVFAFSELTEQRREPWRRLFRRLFGLPAQKSVSLPHTVEPVRSCPH